MRHIITLLILFIFIWPYQAQAEILQVESYVEGATVKGEARLKYMMWDVYDATLYTPNGSYDDNKPFALKLDYLLDLNGKQIAKRSIKEMRKQGFKDEEKLSIWLGRMTEIFPDVSEGNSITGIRDQNGHAVFYKDSKKIGKIEDLEFTQKFFDIWLSPKTSEPEMRKQLLGLK